VRATRDVNRGRFAIYEIGGNFSRMPSSATKTIDHATLLRRMAAGVISGARVIGQPGGWGVVIEDGTTWCSLAARRGGVRLFRRFETLAGYLREIGLDRFEVDVSVLALRLLCDGVRTRQGGCSKPTKRPSTTAGSGRE
jgi:hypothetical protein